MTDEKTLSSISAADLAEQWFALRNRTWRAVTAAVRRSGIDQKALADRIDMDPGQFNKIVTGKKSNLTLRTLHNIARAVNHRLYISLEPLDDLPKPNYRYESDHFRVDAKPTSGTVVKLPEPQTFQSDVRSTSKESALEPML
jgi:transcriptional regulator with XRE-family HTH domain